MVYRLALSSCWVDEKGTAACYGTNVKSLILLEIIGDKKLNFVTKKYGTSKDFRF